jgi:alkanesulfonate monooxygenase SsuD/methylene tetrahydromethanopterin reductase-like flavin-dependent oxidoreductase (luciferase family)
MTLEVGYLLPTRERIVKDIHETGEILDLADHAEAVGIDTVWIGDSLLAKPRHDPITLMAAIAGRTKRVKMGTAVMLPMLRNPVVLAQQLATLDQIAEGRAVLGLGTARDIQPIRDEFMAAGVPFEKRIRRMLELMELCRALWTGEKVDWDGLWKVKGGQLAPRPFTPGGPKLWGGGGVPAALNRAGRYFDGWFPSGAGGPAEWTEGWNGVKQAAVEAGRNPADITGAVYTTIAVHDDPAKANAELDEYLEGYYMQPAELIRKQQYCFAGNLEEVTGWIGEFVEGGCTHFSARFTGSEDRAQMETLVAMREKLAG